VVRGLTVLLLAGAVGCVSAPAPQPSASGPPAAVIHEARYEDYTRYELLGPETAQFKIQYETAATEAGATAYFNPIRKGSEAADERVFDFSSGKPLPFGVVSGAAARQTGLPDADLDTQYIRVTLPRPVPQDGLVRLFIEKTYRDPKSYFLEGDAIVFSRPLGVRRNAVVLPAGYEVTACNVPSQILSEPDGRIQVSFVNSAPDPASLILKARRLGP
jgi:hypothetical protein